MAYFIFIRIKQAYRLLQETGWAILLVLVVVTAALWVPALDKLSQATPSQALFLSLIIGLALQLSRKDRTFLQQLALPAPLVCLADLCLLLGMPAAFLLATGNYLAALAMAGGLGAALLPPGLAAGIRTGRANLSLAVIPLFLFELRATGRQQAGGWLLTALLQAGIWLHIGFFLGTLLLGLVLLSSSFEYLEPKELLPVHHRELIRKWRRTAAIFHLFFSPAYLQVLIWQPGYFWLLVYAIAALETQLALVFFYKYALWQPGVQRLSATLYTAIGLILILLPGGILIAVPLAAWTTRRGLKRIKQWWSRS